MSIDANALNEAQVRSHLDAGDTVAFSWCGERSGVEHWVRGSLMLDPAACDLQYDPSSPSTCYAACTLRLLPQPTESP